MPKIQLVVRRKGLWKPAVKLDVNEDNLERIIKAVMNEFNKIVQEE